MSYGDPFHAANYLAMLHAVKGADWSILAAYDGLLAVSRRQCPSPTASVS